MQNPVIQSEWVDRIVALDPGRTAVIDVSADPAIALSYAQLSDLADRIAQGFLNLGVRPGEYVTYQLPNGWEFVAITLALWKIGAVPCPLLPQLREREVKFMVESSGSRILIAPDEFRHFQYADMLRKVKESVPGLEQVFILESGMRVPGSTKLGGLLAGRADKAAIAARQTTVDMPAQLLYTSGTTGEPKGVVHTHATLSHAIFAHLNTLHLTQEDVVWIPSPVAHQTGFLYGMALSWALGTAGVYQAIWNVEGARIAIERHGVRFVQAAMPFLADLARAERPPKGIRLFVATGAAIPRQLAHEARSALGCRVVGAWGTTESGLVTVGRPEDPDEKLWGTDGRVMEGMAIRIVDAQGKEVPLGTEGRFVVRTPAMFVTYLHHPEWYEAAFDADGFYDAGDLGIMDADGYVRITGRQKDVVNRGGEKIPVVEVEGWLYQHPDVQDVAVVAMPDPRLNERACAFVVKKDPARPLTLADLTQYLESIGMAKIYWPERLEVIDELPRTASGKVQKYVLRKIVVEHLEAELAHS